MDYAGYVITGYVLTAAVLGLYWYRLVARTRHARRVESRLPDVEDSPQIAR